MRRLKVQGICFPQKSVLYTGIWLFFPELFLLVLYAFDPSPVVAGAMLSWLTIFGSLLVLVSILHFLRIISIRKECCECQLGFHIIEHEIAHLKLNSRDEDLVDKETLKQTGSKLFPIILSKPKLCKDCVFRRKKYFVAATEYAEGQKEGRSTDSYSSN
jgi:hypothetical protein